MWQTVGLFFVQGGWFKFAHEDEALTAYVLFYVGKLDVGWCVAVRFPCCCVFEGIKSEGGCEFQHSDYEESLAR